MSGPQTLIVGDVAVKEVNSFCSKKNTKVLCFTNDMIWHLRKFFRHRCWSSNREISHLTPRSLWCCEATIWGIETRLHWSVEQSLSTLWCVSGLGLGWPSTDCLKRWWEIQQVVDVEQTAQSYIWRSVGELYWQFPISLRQMDSALMSQE